MVDISDLETLVEDIRDDVRRVRRLSNAAHALAVAVKNEVEPSALADVAKDEAWRVELARLADVVLTELQPARTS